jgi:hypothetical protein
MQVCLIELLNYSITSQEIQKKIKVLVVLEDGGVGL